MARQAIARRLRPGVDHIHAVRVAADEQQPAARRRDPAAKTAGHHGNPGDDRSRRELHQGDGIAVARGRRPRAVADQRHITDDALVLRVLRRLGHDDAADRPAGLGVPHPHRTVAAAADDGAPIAAVAGVEHPIGMGGSGRRINGVVNGRRRQVDLRATFLELLFDVLELAGLLRARQHTLLQDGVVAEHPDLLHLLRRLGRGRSGNETRSCEQKGSAETMGNGNWSNENWSNENWSHGLNSTRSDREW